MGKAASKVSNVITNAFGQDSLIRRRLANLMGLGLTHSGRRDMYEAFGYPTEISVQQLNNMYLRNSIGGRAVRAYPQATWRDTPVVRDDRGSSLEEDSDDFSPFAAAVDDFFTTRKVMRYLERFDRVSSIGRYGVLVLGFRDNKRLIDPLDEGHHELAYMSPYSEVSVSVSQWDNDQTSDRFGMPVVYTINQQNDIMVRGGTNNRQVSFNVHWTRVIHTTEFPDNDDIFGVPRLLNVYNHLLDAEKVLGGGAETFWLNANRGLGLWVDGDASLTTEEIMAMKAEAENFQDQLARVMVGRGVQAQSLGSDVADPEPNMDKLIEIISGGLGIPKRILVGSEQGELASSQDENNWNARVDERRINYATPSILTPFVQKMIDTGNLPEPRGKWWCEWPEASLDPEKESSLMQAKSNALATYSNAPNAQLVMPVEEFRRDVLKVDPQSEFDLEIELLEEVPEDETEAETLPGSEGEEEREPATANRHKRSSGRAVHSKRTRRRNAKRNRKVSRSRR